MDLSQDQLKEISDSTADHLRGKIDDSQVEKAVALINSVTADDAVEGKLEAVSSNDTTKVTGTVICAIFYWRITLDTPDGHHFVGNAGGIGSIGGGGLQGGYLKGVPDLATLYANAHAFQFNSAAVALNVNFFDKNSNIVGTYVGGGVGICMGTGGGSGSWST